MAISWGGWDGHLTVGVETTVSPSNPDYNDSSVDVTIKWYVGTDGWDYADAQTLTYSIDDTGSTNYTNNLSGSHTNHQGGVVAYMLVATRVKTVTLNYGSTQTKTYRADLSGSYLGETPAKQVNVTIPARPYQPPAAPSTPSVSRNSDTSQAVTWTRNNTSSAPYSSQSVQRRTFANGAWGSWSTIANVSGTATSFTDTSTIANRAYQYRMTATNSTATSSASGSSGTVYTTPGQPQAVTAAKNGSNDIVITITRGSHVGAIEHVIEHSADGGGYTALATVADTSGALGATQQYTHVSPNTSQTHRYRVAHRVDNVSAEAGDNLTSAFVTSNTVQLASAPSAPTGLTATPSPADFDTDGSPTFAWVHNPTDTSPQSNYQLRCRIQGAPSWTTGTKTASATSSATMDALITSAGASNGDVLEWQVSTWGQDTSLQSPWSASATVTLTTQPTATISDPSNLDVLTGSTLNVAFGYFQAESSPQSQWRITLLKSGVQVDQKSGTGTGTTTQFTGLQDASSYTLRAEVKSTAGLWSDPYDIALTTDFLPPALVDVVATYYEDTAAVTLEMAPQPPVGGVTVDATSVDIERSVDLGDTWVLVAQGVDPSSTIVDTQPTINGVNMYRYTIYSDTPTSREQFTVTPYDITLCDGTTLNVDAYTSVVACEQNNSFLTTGPGFSQLVVVMCEARISASSSREKSIQHFAGREWPVQMASDQKSQSITVSTTMAGLDDTDSYAALEELAFTEDIVLWRDPTGRRMYGSIGPVNAGQAALFVPHVWNPGFTIRRVDHDG